MIESKISDNPEYDVKNVIYDMNSEGGPSISSTPRNLNYMDKGRHSDISGNSEDYDQETLNSVGNYLAKHKEVFSDKSNFSLKEVFGLLKDQNSPNLSDPDYNTLGDQVTNSSPLDSLGTNVTSTSRTGDTMHFAVDNNTCSCIKQHR